MSFEGTAYLLYFEYRKSAYLRQGDNPLGKYLSIIETRVSPASRGEERRDEIVSIDFAGPKTAFAKVHCVVGERYFTDFPTFIKAEGRWQIISKVFHYDIADAKQDDAKQGSAHEHQ